MPGFDSSDPTQMLSSDDIKEDKNFIKEIEWQRIKRNFSYHFRKLTEEDQKKILLHLTEIYLFDTKGNSNSG